MKQGKRGFCYTIITPMPAAAHQRVFVYGIIAMATILVVSNYLVQFPLPGALGAWLTWAAFTYPFAFLVTDSVNRAATASTAARVVVFGFVFGVPLSFAFNFWTADAGAWVGAVRISIASGLAFAAGQAVDVYLFNRWRANRRWWLPPVLSSTPASIVDGVCFFALAFAGTAVVWLPLAAGDLAIKLLMIPLLLLPYRWLLTRTHPHLSGA